MLSIEGKHIHEVKMTDKIKKNSDKKEDEEKKKLKGQEKKTENTCIYSLILSIIMLFKEVVFDISFKV